MTKFIKPGDHLSAEPCTDPRCCTDLIQVTTHAASTQTLIRGSTSNKVLPFLRITWKAEGSARALFSVDQFVTVMHFPHLCAHFTPIKHKHVRSHISPIRALLTSLRAFENSVCALLPSIRASNNLAHTYSNFLNMFPWYLICAPRY